MQSPISVTTLNNQIKSLLEAHYTSVLVEAEVSRVTYHTSGHLYFSLKDEKSSISAVMFKTNAQKLKFRLEEGMKVIVSGSIAVYTPRGSYQINCKNIEPFGSGALALAYEQLKAKLEKKGYFDKSAKKPLPIYPKHIALVTSKTGAAIEDLLKVAKKRWPLLKITLIDTLVQGESAALNIAQNIEIADTLGCDIVVIGRGGGSIEDLWAFNEEIVADAIYKANTPIVSAVGHEIDFLISDFVADLRAPTPSGAMEMILPDITEALLSIDMTINRYNDVFKNIIAKKESMLLHLKELFDQNSAQMKLSLYHEKIINLKTQLENYFILSLEKKKRTLDSLFLAYENADPAKRDKVGFGEISKDGKKIDLLKLNIGDKFFVQSSKVKIEAEVLNKKEL